MLLHNFQWFFYEAKHESLFLNVWKVFSFPFFNVFQFSSFLFSPWMGNYFIKREAKTFLQRVREKSRFHFWLVVLALRDGKTFLSSYFFFFSEKGRKKKGNRNLFEDLKSEKIVDETNCQIVVLGEVKHICFWFFPDNLRTLRIN